MSDLRVTSLRGRKLGTVPTLPDGAVVTGVTTSTSFSGNVTGNVTGNVIGDSNITGTTGTFTGNVSVGGTLTYDDVTDIDSVGVVTARAGIKIGAGQSVSAVSGIVTYYGDGSKLSGVESGVVNFVASGTIPNGATVVINTDGTVGIVTQTGSPNSSIGSVVTVNTLNSQPTAAYDVSSGKVVISWSEWNGSAYNGRAIVGTVSGTSISFGTKIEYESAGTSNNSPAYDSANGRVFIAWKLQTNDYLKGVVLTTNSIETNLTAENYIGIAAEAISNGATGKINVVTGTNTGQTGLTTAQKYFVQNNGTLATSAGSPSVVAGTAISDTKIVVR